METLSGAFFCLPCRNAQDNQPQAPAAILPALCHLKQTLPRKAPFASRKKYETFLPNYVRHITAGRLAERLC